MSPPFRLSRLGPPIQIALGKPHLLSILMGFFASILHHPHLCRRVVPRTDAEPQLLADYLFALIENNANISSNELSQVRSNPSSYRARGVDTNFKHRLPLVSAGDFRIRRDGCTPARPDTIFGHSFQIISLARCQHVLQPELETHPNWTRFGKQEAKAVGLW